MKTDIYWARYYADGWKQLPGPLPENTESLRAIGFLRPFLTRRLLNLFLQDPRHFDTTIAKESAS